MLGDVRSADCDSRKDNSSEKFGEVHVARECGFF